MALTFDIGEPDKPRGHAILYFRSLASSEVLATYVLILPIQMDMGKYLPPLLASQLGGAAAEMMGEGMSSFAAPPVPEAVESVGYLERLARLRGDDLVSGGDVTLGDAAAAMHEAAEAVQEYNRLYRQHVESAAPPSAEPQAIEAAGAADVQRVLYDLMSERDRLGELSKLVGTMRFAVDRGDSALADETDAGLQALEQLLPEHYWIAKVRVSARDTSDAGARLSQLYVERCYKLLDEDYRGVEELERTIAEVTGDAPPSEDLRA